VSFPDEMVPVRVVAYRADWPGEFQAVADSLRPLAVAAQGSIDHIGSTSVPGLAAKDVIDVQVRVPELSAGGIADLMADLGYRRRHEPWNNEETTAGESWPKLVFAGPMGQRPVNVHIRLRSSTGARYALLFRDFLRANPAERDTWGRFKTRLADDVTDVAAYGQIKAGPWTLLMQLADAWATRTGWRPDDGS
jgi:GrpB-like predicted nucleotidyltransferase (UPF0157 family)